MRKQQKHEYAYLKAVQRKERRRTVLTVSLLLVVTAMLILPLFGIVRLDMFKKAFDPTSVRYKVVNVAETSEKDIRKMLYEDQRVILVRKGSSASGDTVNSVHDLSRLEVPEWNRSIASAEKLQNPGGATDPFGPMEEDPAPVEETPTTPPSGPLTERSADFTDPPASLNTPQKTTPAASKGAGEQANSLPLAESKQVDLPDNFLKPKIKFTGFERVGQPISFGITNYQEAFFYELNFGDGTVKPLDENISHTYLQPGTYALSLLGSSPSVPKMVFDTLTLTISEESVVDRITGDNEAAPGGSISLSNPKPAAPKSTTPVQQGSTTSPEENAKPMYAAQEMPQFPGGFGAMNRFIKENLDLTGNTEPGVVFVQFVVEDDGTISNPQITRSLNPIADAAVIKVIESMPKWIPGKENGKSVTVYKGLTVEIP